MTLTRSNVISQKSWFSFGKKPQWQTMPDREILTHSADIDIGLNKISTSKYNFITFLPKNLFEQFSKLANLYFLVKFCLFLTGFYIKKTKVYRNYANN